MQQLVNYTEPQKKLYTVYLTRSWLIGMWNSKWAASWQNQQNGMYAQLRLRSAWTSAQSDQSLCCALNGWLRTRAFFMRTAKILIRLGGCPGWFESSLGAHAILLVLSRGGLFELVMSYCIFKFFKQIGNGQAVSTAGLVFSFCQKQHFICWLWSYQIKLICLHLAFKLFEALQQYMWHSMCKTISDQCIFQQNIHRVWKLSNTKSRAFFLFFFSFFFFFFCFVMCE